MTTYVALVHGEPGSYGVSLPDLPGCTSGGTTVDEALAKVRLAAADWMESARGDGHAIPTPSSIEALRRDPEFEDDFADVVLVAGVDIDPPGRAVRLNITLDEALLARIDRAASEAGESRSGWLGTAARQRMMQDVLRGAKTPAAKVRAAKPPVVARAKPAKPPARAAKKAARPPRASTR